ncbi:hypothetical protein G5B00_13015 [Parapedobacter sp. SGR-10]|uniref:putative glycoside hydrolase n=1 Tax=Parapedobacter sp. SGR-10 TaxID=2710879 RepID=UPI0013D0BF0A|nr:putative glycoside hydrolase [Parapedobacter sp. SGR-10]NGF57431.1 hypothetical protein [Parapedobacter sp. SGR-10]
MKKISLLIICALALSVSLNAQNQTIFLGSSGIPSHGIPMAQIFDNQIKDKSVYQQQKNKVFYVWGSRSSEQPEYVTGSKYFPSIRNPDRKLDIKWYQENHPDWIMYQEDRKTPAYGYIYSYGGLVPLDVSNPEVREYYLQKFIMPAVQAGYKVIAMDNVDLGNWPKAVGRYSGNEWVKLYTGQKNDTTFHKNMIGWMQFLKDKLNPLGIALVGNIKANSAPEPVVLEIIQAVDAWLDENGFAHRGINVTDDKWEKAMAIIHKITPEKGYISINQMKGEHANDWPKEQVEYVIGNYLLSRGPSSLLAMVGYTDKAIYHHFSYRKEIDTDIGEPVSVPTKLDSGLWIRRYSKGLVIVNPSSKETRSFKLPKGIWSTWDNDTVEGKINIPAASAKVLSSK